MHDVGPVPDQQAALGVVLVVPDVEVDPLEARDVAKPAMRRTFVTSALVCGRLPKLIGAELGHATARMVTENYDSFMDPASWPGPAEIARLRVLYGWRDEAAMEAEG